MSGAAIECRIYAEDPAEGFLPQSGRLIEWQPPAASWLRVDSGVESGSEVSIHYDPMLAKVIAWGGDRAQAIDRMRWALARLSIAGPRTNRDFLLGLLGHPAFRAGELDPLRRRAPRGAARRPAERGRAAGRRVGGRALSAGRARRLAPRPSVHAHGLPQQPLRRSGGALRGGRARDRGALRGPRWGPLPRERRHRRRRSDRHAPHARAGGRSARELRGRRGPPAGACAW
ncbi:MAG: hypothetical protein M5U28_02575 [Sandaracinaceae bacterium]|nr:hypothetical protein [Sandaracinaceae bacterium]